MANVLITFMVVGFVMAVYGISQIAYWWVGVRRVRRMTYINNAWAKAQIKPLSHNEIFWAFDQVVLHTPRTAVHPSLVGADRVAYV